MLGSSLLARKAAAGRTANLVGLAKRLNKIARHGTRILDDLDDSYPAELLDHQYALLARPANGDGAGA